jgi:hypothetical protein
MGDLCLFVVVFLCDRTKESTEIALPSSPL